MGLQWFDHEVPMKYVAAYVGSPVNAQYQIFREAQWNKQNPENWSHQC